MPRVKQIPTKLNTEKMLKIETYDKLIAFKEKIYLLFT